MKTILRSLASLLTFATFLPTLGLVTSAAASAETATTITPAQECDYCEDSACPSHYLWLEDDAVEPDEMPTAGINILEGLGGESPFDQGCYYQGEPTHCNEAIECSGEGQASAPTPEEVEGYVASSTAEEVVAFIERHPEALRLVHQREAVAVYGGCSGAMVALVPLRAGQGYAIAIALLLKSQGNVVRIHEPGFEVNWEVVDSDRPALTSQASNVRTGPARINRRNANVGAE